LGPLELEPTPDMLPIFMLLDELLNMEQLRENCRRKQREGEKHEDDVCTK